MKIGKYNYDDDVMETVKISKRIRDDFNEFCKSKGIIKSKLIEKFYKEILVASKSGSLDSSDGNFSIYILSGTISKSK